MASAAHALISPESSNKIRQAATVRCLRGGGSTSRAPGIRSRHLFFFQHKCRRRVHKHCRHQHVDRRRRGRNHPWWPWCARTSLHSFHAKLGSLSARLKRLQRRKKAYSRFTKLPVSEKKNESTQKRQDNMSNIVRDLDQKKTMLLIPMFLETATLPI